MFALMESHHDSEYACARDSIRLVIRPEEGRSPSETGSRVYEGKPRGKNPVPSLLALEMISNDNIGLRHSSDSLVLWTKQESIISSSTVINYNEPCWCSNGA